jgi:hypothetical protein
MNKFFLTKRQEVMALYAVGWPGKSSPLPPYETAVMGKKTKQKKNFPKVGNFGILFLTGVRCFIFFGIRVGKKILQHFNRPLSF